MGKSILTRREFVRAGAGAAAIGAAAQRPSLVRRGWHESCKSHTWEKFELAFVSGQTFKNPYTDATVWVDLTGPGFHKRVYGFWDGGNSFKVRVTATAPGVWHWRSGSEPHDVGLAGKTGSFVAREWTEEEKQENPLRRGFLQATPNHHALQTADGTPFFVIGDTWYAVGTNRFKWYDDDVERPMGPTAGFKDFVRYRKAQGFNWVNVIAAFPNWETDGLALAHCDGRCGQDDRALSLAWSSAPAAPRTWTTRAGGPLSFRARYPAMRTCFQTSTASIRSTSSTSTERSTT